MAWSVYQFYVVDETGVVLPGAAITVRDSLDALAMIASDDAGTPMANPFAADENALARFFVQSGVYKIEITYGGATWAYDRVPIGSARGADIGPGDRQVSLNEDGDLRWKKRTEAALSVTESGPALATWAARDVVADNDADADIFVPEDFPVGFFFWLQRSRDAAVRIVPDGADAIQAVGGGDVAEIMAKYGWARIVKVAAGKVAVFGADVEAAPWTPASLIQAAADGSWFRGDYLGNKWVDTAGTTPVAADDDPIGKWIDELDQRALTAASPGERFFWDAGAAAVRIDYGTFTALSHLLSSPVPAGQPVTIFATLRATSTSDYARGLLGISGLDSNYSYVILNPRLDGGDTTMGTPRTYVGGHPITGVDVSAPSPGSARAAFSFSRGIDGKLKNLYIDGTLADDGATVTQVADAPATQIYIFGNEYAPGQAMYLHDFVVYFGEADAALHAKYAAYGASLP